MKRKIIAFTILSSVLLLGGCSLFQRKETSMTNTEDHTEFTLSSSAFESGGTIPAKYAKSGPGGGENVSIPLEWSNVPEGTVSFALMMVDTHQVARGFIHWLVSDIPGTTTSFAEGASGSLQGNEHKNNFGEAGYGGPFPPEGQNHSYEITIYALKDIDSLNLPEGITMDQFQEAILDHVIAQDTIVGYFER